MQTNHALIAAQGEAQPAHWAAALDKLLMCTAQSAKYNPPSGL